MKSKAPLLMMEQLIMTLVFALAAALCLRCFAQANEISIRTARQDEAVMIAQNAAELLKAGRNPDEMNPQSEYRLEIIEQNSATADLAEAEIRVYFDDEMLFSLRTGWQEAEK